MAEFLVILKQKSDGCGHKIGCGVALETIEAENTAAVLDALQKKWSQDWGLLDTAGKLDGAWIVPACEALSIPIEIWKGKLTKARARALEVHVERKRREHCEQLKRS